MLSASYATSTKRRSFEGGRAHLGRVLVNESPVPDLGHLPGRVDVQDANLHRVGKVVGDGVAEAVKEI
jgi:hypothetical protein